MTPSEVSRELVQLVLRTSTSTSPDCSAVKRSFAVSGTNFTLVGSSKIAAAIARQTSTSRPVQLPWASGRPNPARPGLEPQLSAPRVLTVVRVWASAEEAAKPSAAAQMIDVRTRFMTQTAPIFCCSKGCCSFAGRCGGSHRIRWPSPPVARGTFAASTPNSPAPGPAISVRSFDEVKGLTLRPPARRRSFSTGRGRLLALFGQYEHDVPGADAPARSLPLDVHRV